MKQLLPELEGFRIIERAVRNGETPLYAHGLAAIHKAHFAHVLREETGRGALVFCADEGSATRLAEDLCRMSGKNDAILFPEREFVYHPMESVSREYEQQRLGALRRLQTEPSLIAVASAAAAMQPVPAPEKLTENIVTLRVGEEFPPDRLTDLLLNAGYARADQVEGIGQFSRRGGILDVFPPQRTRPVRVEYWGDAIDTLSGFRVETQRREDRMETAEITPVRELLYDPARLAGAVRETLREMAPEKRALCGKTLEGDARILEETGLLQDADRYFRLIEPEPHNLLSYAGNRMVIWAEGVSLRDALEKTREAQEKRLRELERNGELAPGAGFRYPDPEAAAAECLAHPLLVFDGFPRGYRDLPFTTVIPVRANVLSVWNGQLNPLAENLRDYAEKGWSVHLLGGTRRGAAAIAGDLRERGCPVRFVNPAETQGEGNITISPGGLSSGFEYPDLRWAVMTCSRFTAPERESMRRRRPKGAEAVRGLSDLTPGDYVVHSAHGIGIFEGVVKRETQRIVKDYIKIRYAGTDVLFVPVTQLDLVSRYIGGRDENDIRLSRLGGTEWKRTRRRVRESVEAMAKELLELYARRQTVRGHSFAADSDWQREIEEKFEYEETGDQLICTGEIKRDMESPVPMERILCGDVGFGKTEVALRAAVKCVLDGKQCAVLVPTTILAWQHFQTFRQRLDGYPICVELLSRFLTPNQQKEVLRRNREGKVDIVIGTHRLVQEDVRFRDLGLCIVDEEQRFGVRQKEKLKQLRGNVDVLTLSATPIPRTLNMAMSGIRDMSVISEPPRGRKPVQCFVLEYDDGVIEEAIRRELRRGGQVFYLHNRIDSIELAAHLLQERFPEARIVTAHGRMDEEEISDAWRRLLDQKIDILVCTTIIESGIDVPNCNTLIVEDADRMGLAQLYQLRGRVGRSERRAYAYFTFRKGRALSPVSEKRLQAIREFTSFGSGFRIAMRDLEIRGAGNILGSEQHGQMEAVGYDLYIKLLGEAIRRQKGEPPRETLECQVDIELDAHIPEQYIPALPQRIDAYKKIAAILDEADRQEVLDELTDRFGRPPDSVVGLLDVALIRGRAARLGIREVNERNGSLLFFGTGLVPRTAARLQETTGRRVLLGGREKPYLSVRPAAGEKTPECIRRILSALETVREEERELKPEEPEGRAFPGGNDGQDTPGRI